MKSIYEIGRDVERSKAKRRKQVTLFSFLILAYNCLATVLALGFLATLSYCIYSAFGG